MIIREMIDIVPLNRNDRELFIRDNQYAFRYGATEEFGLRDSHFEEDGEIISRKTIEACIDAPNAETYRIMLGDAPVGGVVIHTDGMGRGTLDLLFVAPCAHGNGVGYAAWQAIERLHPEILVWETVTPYFEKRNIHFYVNRCGFHIVEFFNSHHPDPNEPDIPYSETDDGDGMFRFEKHMRDAK